MVDRQDEVDRASPVPLYHQLEAALRGDIERGRLEPGDPLPFEGEICDIFGVSRSVVRQSLTNLAHSGLIRTERGRGSFVAEHKFQERFVQHTTGLYDDLRRMGRRIRTRVLSLERVVLPSGVQTFLEQEHGICLDRLRSVDGRKLAYIRTYLSEERCNGILDADLEDRSLYDYLQDHYGLRPASGRRTVEAVGVPDSIADHLEVPVASPILLLRSRSWDEKGLPLEWFDAWHRADRTMFEIEILPGLPDQPINSVVTDLELSDRRDQRRHLRNQPDRTPVTSMQPATDEAVGDDRREPLRWALRTGRTIVSLPSGEIQNISAIVAALADNGFTVISLPFGASGLGEAIEVAGRIGVHIGVHGILEAAEYERALTAGVAFVVAPPGMELEPATADAVPALATAYSPSEVARAWHLTRLPVIVYPASIGGPNYISAVAQATGDAELMASGGIEADRIGEYLAAGALAVDVGESLCAPEGLAAGGVEKLRTEAERLRRDLLDGGHVTEDETAPDDGT